MRLLFKFYKSYYDVAKELNDKDRLAFFDALLKKQFTGENTDLKGMANFAYISQKHSIESQVKGWEDKMKTPIAPPVIPPIAPPVIQVKEKEKEEVKEKEKEEVKEKEKPKFIVPDISEVEQYFVDNGFRADVGRDKWHYYNDANWIDSHGSPVLNWKQKMRGVWFKDENKIKQSQGGKKQPIV